MRPKVRKGLHGRKGELSMNKKKLPLAFWIFIGLVAGIDRIFDMGRTTINITGDAACAVVVSKMEDRKVARTKSVLG